MKLIGSSSQQDSPQSQPENPGTAESEFERDLNAAAGGEPDPTDPTVAPQGGPEPESTEQQRAFFFSKLIGQKVAPGLIRFPFAKLAANDHPAWMPSDEEVLGAVPAVQGGIEEVLDLVVPELLDRYASRFPRIMEACGTLVALWFTQWTLVRKMKAVDAQEAAAAAQARTVEMPKTDVATAGL
jgi:hypothetical protein